MSTPRKHHYVPAFYLNQWAGPDGRLCEYKRIFGKVVPRRTFANGTGYEKDLYRIDGLPEPLCQAVEKEFMRMVDTNAHHAFEKIARRDKSRWGGEIRSDFIRFLFSLRFRNPQSVTTIKDHIVNVWNEGLAHLRIHYDELRNETDPATFEEFVKFCEPGAPYRAAYRLLQEIIDNPRVGATVIKMSWNVVFLQNTTITLLTSDRPLDMPFGLHSPSAYIALPIGPRAVFVAAHDSAWVQNLAAADPTKVAKRINQTVVEQARMFVWGVDDQQLRFVRNRMSRAPDPPIISEQQKQRALQAARGR